MDVLKGNYKSGINETVKAVIKEDDKEDSFKKEALKNLGGSIGYVSKKRFMWLGEEGEDKEK